MGMIPQVNTANIHNSCPPELNIISLDESGNLPNNLEDLLFPELISLSQELGRYPTLVPALIDDFPIPKSDAPPTHAPSIKPIQELIPTSSSDITF